MKKNPENMFSFMYLSFGDRIKRILLTAFVSLNTCTIEEKEIIPISHISIQYVYIFPMYERDGEFLFIDMNFSILLARHCKPN